MKILVISKEAWRHDQNGGNVLSNIFSGIDAEFAQIYCSAYEANNSLCRLYYQMTDKMMIQNILNGTPVGIVKDYAVVPNTNDNPGTRPYENLKRFRIPGLRYLQELAWGLANWNISAIEKFVTDFNPDIIFAPCYGSHYMHRLTRLVRKFSKAPIISYISDDFYTNRQLRFSPLFWINHFLLRMNTRSIFKLYSLVYTMTDEQKAQCERDFGANVKILRKSGTFSDMFLKKSVNAPIRFVYAGGIYLNRWRTLIGLVKSIRHINSSGIKMVLDIYTNNELPNQASDMLNDGVNSVVHKAVSSEKLRDIYHGADVALHVEGFDLRNKLAVRLSFSTKIVDCLDSGCAVMAICDSKQAGFAYLKRNHAAICISSLKDIESMLRKIVCNPDILIDYQQQAFRLGRKHHNAERTKIGIIDDFNKILCKKS